MAAVRGWGSAVLVVLVPEVSVVMTMAVLVVVQVQALVVSLAGRRLRQAWGEEVVPLAWGLLPDFLVL